MTEAVAIGLTIALTLSVLGNFYAWLTTRKMAGAPEAVLAHGKAQIAAERELIEAERQRDINDALLKKTAGELQDALAELRTTKTALDAATKRSLDAVAAKIRAAVDPLAALREQLQDGADMPASGASGDASPGDGGQGSPAVQPTE